MYEVNQLTPEELAGVMKKVEQEKYREKLIEAAAEMGAGMMIEVNPAEFMALYSSLTTLRVWAGKLGKKYPDRRYVVVTDDKTGNTCLCRVKQ